MSAWLLTLLGAVQAFLATRVAWRLLATGRERHLCVPVGAPPAPGSVAVLLPVLDEAARIEPCLAALRQLGPEVGVIVVADGGSHDATVNLVRAAAQQDSRIRLVVAGPAPADWNGKVWGLHAAERGVGTVAQWLLLVDADVHVRRGLPRALLARAERRGLRLLSVAAPQRLAGALDGLLHPALLTTLVYRFGRPNTVTADPAAVLANGQGCLLARGLLGELGGFAGLRESLCEDMTLARTAARQGEPVGFYEAPGLLEVQMYANWREAWRNWPRSLATRDATFGLAGWLGLLEMFGVQALPWLLLGWRPGRRLALGLLGLRLGVLVGTARAYPARPWTYWLSPLADLPVAVAVWRAALQRRHAWRGRTYLAAAGRIAA